MVLHVLNVPLHALAHRAHLALDFFEEVLLEIVYAHHKVDILHNEFFLLDHAVRTDEELFGVVSHTHELYLLVVQRA